MAPEASFKVALYMKPFYPSDIHIKSADNNSFILHAKHDEHVDQHGIVKRELIREYKLPEGISVKLLEFEFTRNGIMIIRAVQAASEKISELKVKPAEKKEAPEKMECAESPLKFVGIEISEQKESEPVQESELAEQTIEEKRKIASFLGLKLDSAGKAMPFKFDTEPSLESSSVEKMEVEGEATSSPQSSSTEIVETKGTSETTPCLESSSVDKMEVEAEATSSPQSSSTEIVETKDMSETTPCPQSSSTERMGDIEGIRGPPFPIIMKAMETARSPQSSPTKAMEATEPVQSSQSIPTEITKTTETPQLSSTDTMETTETPQLSSTNTMETTETPQLSSTDTMEATETAHGPSSSSGETMKKGGGST